MGQHHACAGQVQEQETQDQQQKNHQDRETQGQQTERGGKAAQRDGGQGTHEESEEREQERNKDNRTLFQKHPRAKPALVVFVLLLVIGGGLWYWHYRQWESTDDAQVDGYVYGISGRINGHVVNVTVNDGDHVQAGQVLAEIDPTDYQVAYESARAKFENAQAGLLAAELNVPISSVGSRSQISSAEADVLSSEASISGAQQQQAAAEQELAQAKSNAHQAAMDVSRYKQLINKREISQQMYDQAVTNADSLNAMVAAREASVKAANDQIEQARGRMTQSTAALQNARITPKQVGSTQARMKAHRRSLIERAPRCIKHN